MFASEDLTCLGFKVDRIQARMKQTRKQIEDLEEEISRERMKARQLQRTIDERNETNENLARENSQLKTSVTLSRRAGKGRSGTRFTSNFTPLLNTSFFSDKGARALKSSV